MITREDSRPSPSKKVHFILMDRAGTGRQTTRLCRHEEEHNWMAPQLEASRHPRAGRSAGSFRDRARDRGTSGQAPTTGGPPPRGHEKVSGGEARQSTRAQRIDSGNTPQDWAAAVAEISSSLKLVPLHSNYLYDPDHPHP